MQYRHLIFFFCWLAVLITFAWSSADENGTENCCCRCIVVSQQPKNKEMQPQATSQIENIYQPRSRADVSLVVSMQHYTKCSSHLRWSHASGSHHDENAGIKSQIPQRMTEFYGSIQDYLPISDHDVYRCLKTMDLTEVEGARPSKLPISEYSANGHPWMIRIFQRIVIAQCRFIHNGSHDIEITAVQVNNVRPPTPTPFRSCSDAAPLDL
jgi:hypothetical protein